MIKITSLTKKYKTKQSVFCALDSISMELPNKGFVALYGENGCGKTTLLNLIATIDTAYTGKIEYNNLQYEGNEPYIRRNIISYVFQEDYFIKYLNVKDNLLLFCEDENLNEINRQLDIRKIPEKIEVNPSNLSGGQKQRVSFIRGVTKSSKILLVDEPTSSLNEEMELQVFEEMKELAKEKLVLLVSHNMSLIRGYCDLIIHMDKGKLSQTEELTIGSPVKYDEETITIPSSDYNLGLLDKQKTTTILNQYEKLVVIKSTKTESKTSLNYDIENPPVPLKEKHLSKSSFKSLFLSSTKKEMLSFFFICLVISILGVLFSYSLSFYNFDTAKYTFQSLNQQDEYVNFDLKKTGENMPLDKGEYEYMRNELKTNVIITNRIFSANLDFKNSGIYNNTVHSIAYCKQEDVKLLEGIFPIDNKSILITDYLADGLLTSNSSYSTFADIIELGINSSYSHFDVAGIIETDYEKYKYNFEDIESKQGDEYLDFELKTQNQYATLYFSYDAAFSSNFISNVPLEYGANFADMSSIEEFNATNGANHLLQNSSECYINGKLNENLNLKEENFYIKFKDEIFNVKGVINDGQNIAKIYVRSADIVSIKNNILSNITSMNVKLNSVETVSYLLNKNFTHNMAFSVKIRDTIDIVLLLQNFFVVLIITILLLIAGMIIYSISKTLKKQNTTIAFLKSAGYSKNSIVLLTFFIVFSQSLIVVLLSSLLFIFSALIINLALSNIFSATISLINISLSTILITTLSIIILFVVGWYMIFSFKYKKDLIFLLKESL